MFGAVKGVQDGAQAFFRRLGELFLLVVEEVSIGQLRAAPDAPWHNPASTIPVSRVVEMLRNPGKPFDFNGTRGVYPDVKLAYWVGGNPFAHQQDRNQMVRAWQKLETFIVHDFQWTATKNKLHCQKQL